MKTINAIQTRRSIRSFLDKPVSDEDVIQILDAARLAPSGGNNQNWKFVYINEPKILRMIKNCSTGFYGNPPVALIAGLELKEGVSKASNIGILDIGFAAENISLAAHALGLGTCAIASFNSIGIIKVINSPKNFKPILVFSLGYPDKQPPMPVKKSLMELVYLNEWGTSWKKLEDVK